MYRSLTLAICVAATACNPATPKPAYAQGLNDVVTNVWLDQTVTGFDTDGDGLVDVPLEEACPVEVIGYPGEDPLFFDGTWILGGGLSAAAGLPAGLEFKILPTGDVIIYDDGIVQPFGVVWYCHSEEELIIDTSNVLGQFLSGDRIPVLLKLGDWGFNEYAQPVRVWVDATNNAGEASTGTIDRIDPDPMP